MSMRPTKGDVRASGSRSSRWSARLTGAVLVGVLALARVAAADVPLDATVPDPAACQPDHLVSTTFFGRAIVPLGTQLLISARGAGCDATLPGRGVVYLMDPDGTVVWTFRNPVLGTGDFGASIAVLGGDLVAGAPYDLGSGAAYLMSGSTASLLQNYASPTPSTNDGFGRAVAAVAGTVVVGAPGDDTSGADAGRAFLFDAVTGTLLQTYVNPALGTKSFGATVAVIGTDVLIGAPAYPGSGGTVYQFDRLTGLLERTFASPTATVNGFGMSIAVIGTSVAVGAPFEGVDGAGAAYLFDSPSGLMVNVFDNPRPAANDAFGTSVAAMGTHLLVGAPGITADREGAAYVFDGDLASAQFGALLQILLKAHLVTKTKPDGFGATVAALGDTPIVGGPGYASQRDIAPGTVYRYDACGNGIRGSAEECDDGNTTSGDGCGFCTLELCPETPAAGCRRAPAGSASIILQHPAGDGPADRSRDKLVVRWKGPATSVAEFGAPRTTTSYVLCLYDAGTGTQPLLHAAAPAGGTCVDRPCWQQSGAVIYKYKDRLKSPGGLLSILLRPGDVDGAPFLRFRGRGSSLSLPPLPLATSVTAQIHDTENSVCWDAVYGGDVRANTPNLFKASSD